MLLDDKIVLVTGAGSGIGRALAIELSQRGAQLLLVGRRAEALEETRKALSRPHRGECIAADLTEQEGREQILRAVATHGRLDLLVNNAGVVVSGPLAAQDDEAVRQMFATNLLAPISLTRLLLPLLRAGTQSRIVNVGSMFGDIAFPYFAAYSATKFGLRGWSEALRREIAPLGIGVTYAAPRGTRTPAAASFAALADAFAMRLDPPEQVARQIVNAVAKDARDVYPRGIERLFVLLQRLVPGVIDNALGKQLTKAVARLSPLFTPVP